MIIVGKPGWYYYLAFAGEKPVSTTAMFVNGDVAWVGFMSTLKTYRNRGGQRVMFARCIEQGLALDSLRFEWQRLVRPRNTG